MVSALGLFEAGEAAKPDAGQGKHFHWYDILTVNQDPCGQAAFPPDYFYTTFRDGIAAIGHTLLVLAPWTSPIPLQRSWQASKSLAPTSAF